MKGIAISILAPPKGKSPKGDKPTDGDEDDDPMDSSEDEVLAEMAGILNVPEAKREAFYACMKAFKEA